MKLLKNTQGRKENVPGAEDGKPFGKWKLLGLLLLNLILVFGVYLFVVQVLAEQSFAYYYGLMGLYLGLAAVLVLVYFFYNRALIHRIPEEQLPDTWSAEEKARFKQEGIERQRRSRWILLWLIPLLFTLAWEIVNVFLLQELFPQWFS